MPFTSYLRFAKRWESSGDFMIDEYQRHALKKKYADEQVFIVPYAGTLGIPDRFTPYSGCRTDMNAMLAKGSFIFRCDAEYEPVFQQVIPYILVADSSMERIYVTKRIAGEERLAGSLSIGCGGHINPCDGGNLIANCARRELCEELYVKEPYKLKLRHTGYVRDMQSLTNDHIGVLLLVHTDIVKLRETDKLEGMWYGMPELIADYGKFEGWARHIIDWLYVKGGITALSREGKYI